MIGLGIFYFMNQKSPGVQTFTNKLSNSISKPSPSPIDSPKPTLAPLPANANLELETEKLTPKDYSEDFKMLKDSL